MFWLLLILLTAVSIPNGSPVPYFSLSTSRFLHHLLAGLLLGLTFYTYIPACGRWLLFPALLLLGGVVDRNWLRRVLVLASF